MVADALALLGGQPSFSMRNAAYPSLPHSAMCVWGMSDRMRCRMPAALSSCGSDFRRRPWIIRWLAPARGRGAWALSALRRAPSRQAILVSQFLKMRLRRRFWPLLPEARLAHERTRAFGALDNSALADLGVASEEAESAMGRELRQVRDRQLGGSGARYRQRVFRCASKWESHGASVLFPLGYRLRYE